LKNFSNNPVILPITIGKNIWIFTGYVLEHLIDSNNNDDKLRLKIISECDYLVDGPFIEELKDLSLPFRGSSNQRIIDVELNKIHFNI
jgi:anaerobic ribonucleoside-triphosphate reductase activating protein